MSASITAIVPIYKINSHSSRRRNFLFILQRLLDCGVDILVVEQHSYDKINLSHIHEHVRHIVVDVGSVLFNRSFLFNRAIEETRSEYLWFHDADICMDFSAVIDELNPKYDVLSPYGSVFLANSDQSNEFISNREIEFFPKQTRSIDELCGGSVIFKRDSIVRIGGWNEKYSGWGYEDKELGLRCEKLLNCKRLEQRAIHLFHKKDIYDCSVISKNGRLYSEDKNAIENNALSYFERIESPFSDSESFEKAVLDAPVDKDSVARIILVEKFDEKSIVSIVNDFIGQYDYGKKLYLFNESGSGDLDRMCRDYQINGENIISIKDISSFGDETEFIIYKIERKIDKSLDEICIENGLEVDPSGFVRGPMSLLDEKSFDKFVFLMSHMNSFNPPFVPQKCKRQKIVCTLLSLNNDDFIERTIRSVLPAVDRLIIADGGSTDNSIEIVHSFNSDKIDLIEYGWNNNFSFARSFVLENAQKTDCDWIMQIDSDEMMTESFGSKIQEYIASDELNECHLPIVWVFSENPTKYISSEYHTNVAPYRPRMWRNLQELHYDGGLPVHEKLVTPWGEDGVRAIKDMGVVILHYCYILNSYNDRVKKINFYDKLKEGAGSGRDSHPAYVYENYPFEVRNMDDDMFKTFD